MKKVLLFPILILLASCSKSVEVTEEDCEGGTVKISGVCVDPDQQLNQSPMPGASNSSDKFLVTPDKTKVVYLSDEDTVGQQELFVVNIDGSGRVKISPPLVLDGDVVDFKISPNSQKVAFLADKDLDGRVNLFTVNLDGSNLAQVNAGVSSINHQVFNTFKFMPSSQKIVFVSDEGETVGNHNLYIANVDGSARMKLNINTPGEGHVNSKFEINNTGRIVYSSMAEVSAGEWILSSVLGDGSAYRRLSDLTNDPLSEVQQDSFVISPNGAKVVYLATQENQDARELYSIDIDATNPASRVKISGALTANGNVSGMATIPFQITADSSKVVFVADKDIDEMREIYVVGISSTSPSKLNSLFMADTDVVSFKVSKNSQDVVFMADKDIDNTNELYHVSVNAPLVLTKVNSNLALSEDVLEYQLADTKVVYIHNKLGEIQAYAKNFSSGSETPLHSLSNSPIYDQSSPMVNQMVVDGNRVFLRLALTNGSLDLYSVNLDGSNLKRSHQKDHVGDVLISDTADGSNYIIVGNRVIYRVQEGSKVLYSSLLL